MRWYPIVAAFVLVASLSCEAYAQQLSPEVIQWISAASKIRVQLQEGRWRTLHAPAADSVSLSYGDGRFPSGAGGNVRASSLAVIQLAQIQVARGSHAGSGAKIGGAIGLGLSLLGVAVTAGDDWVSPTTGQAIGVVVAWTAIGAGAGALIGSTSPRWTTVYVSDHPRP